MADNLGYGVENLEGTTLKEVEEMMRACSMRQKSIDVLEEDLEKVKEAQKEDLNKLKSVLEHLGKDGYSSNYGTIEIRSKLSFQTPKTPEQKKAFFEWCQSKGIMWDYITVNSISLNSLCKQESEAALEAGKDFEVPGIEPGKEYKQTVFKRKR
jgi:hypothetical protein